MAGQHEQVGGWTADGEYLTIAPSDPAQGVNLVELVHTAYEAAAPDDFLRGVREGRVADSGVARQVQARMAGPAVRRLV